MALIFKVHKSLNKIPCLDKKRNPKTIQSAQTKFKSTALHERRAAVFLEKENPTEFKAYIQEPLSSESHGTE